MRPVFIPGTFVPIAIFPFYASSSMVSVFKFSCVSLAVEGQYAFAVWTIVVPLAFIESTIRVSNLTLPHTVITEKHAFVHISADFYTTISSRAIRAAFKIVSASTSRG